MSRRGRGKCGTGSGFASKLIERAAEDPGRRMLRQRAPRGTLWDDQKGGSE